MVHRIIVFGISGNIGEQALAVLREDSFYQLVGFSVGDNIKVIPTILKAHRSVTSICVKNESDLKALKNKYPKIKFYCGNHGLIKLLEDTPAEMLLNALVGFVGLAPTLKAISLNLKIALANKESLVVGGELVKRALRHSKSKIYPIDSEHSAIYKCLKACKKRNVREVLITASGGAFRDLTREELKNVTAKQALKHPTWKMGKKVTIDSATMLNKGFEIIEAYYLFSFSLKDIKVIMHDESHVHSILKLKDGTYLAEVNKPNMINPIRYALKNKHLPEDVKSARTLKEFGPYHFRTFDSKRYPMVKYALIAIKKKGIMPCVLNAVDEVAVNLFLNNHIAFLDIERLVDLSLKTFKNIRHPSLKTLIKIDHEAREWAKTAAYLEGTL